MRGENRFGDYFRVAIAGEACVYCGEWATQRDHFPPATCERWGYLLPSCAECNRLAGVEHPYDFEQRVAVVKAKLRSRGQRLLQTPDWSREELGELRGNTKREVERWQKRKDLLQKRLAWPAIEYLSRIDHNSVFALTPVASYFTIAPGNESWIDSEPSRPATPSKRKPLTPRPVGKRRNKGRPQRRKVLP